MGRLHEHQKLPKFRNFFFHLLGDLHEPKLFLAEISADHVLQIHNSINGLINFEFQFRAFFYLVEAPSYYFAGRIVILMLFIEAKVQNPHGRDYVFGSIHFVFIVHLLELQIDRVVAIGTIIFCVGFSALMLKIQLRPKRVDAIFGSQAFPIVQKDFQARKLLSVLEDSFFTDDYNLFGETPNLAIHLLQNYVGPHEFYPS